MTTWPRAACWQRSAWVFRCPARWRLRVSTTWQAATRCYRRCLRDAGLYDPKLELLSPQPSSMRLGGELLEELLRTRPGVDAVFFCNDDLAQGGLLAAQRLGLSVPGQVAIAGFNDLAGSDQMLPPLTTVRTPRAAVGEASARMLLALMRGEVPAHNSVDLGFELTIRSST